MLEQINIWKKAQTSTEKALEITKVRKDLYSEKAHAYLQFAQRCGLDSPEIVDSCFDLAATTTLALPEDDIKSRCWKYHREKYLAQKRRPRILTMQLYPQYFSAILAGIKTYEGRAFDPLSDKKYLDLRASDIIFFKIYKENFGWENDCKELHLNPEMVMKVRVGNVYHAPTVHGIYQFTDAVGKEFQPKLSGVSELLELQRAAIYFTFPGYKSKINSNGFLGIEMLNPIIVDPSEVKQYKD